MDDGADDKNGMVADFQAITGINNAGEALMHLSNFNWDLLAAIQHVMPEHTQQLPSESRSSQPSLPAVTMADDLMDMSASTSNVAFRTLTIDIEQNGRVITTLKVNDCSSFDDLKTLVYANCGIPCCMQTFSGWPTHQFPSPKDKLSKLNLPDRFKLNLNTGIEDSNQELNGRSNVRMFTLNVTMEATSSTQYKVYKFSFPSYQTVEHVKEVVANETKLPVSNQQWLGWPHFVTPTTTLEESHINYPVHDFKLKPTNSVLRHTRRTYNTRLNSVVDMETSDSPMPSSSTSSSSTSSSSSDGDPFEDAAESLSGIDDEDEDAMYMDTEITSPFRPLISADVVDELAGCIQFVEEFQNRYGDVRPDFFLGTLDQAIKVACFKPAKDKRLLAVYLHHDRSVLSNVFCTQLLCFESVVQYLNANFLVWGWDMTHPANRNRILQSASQALGQMAEVTLRAIDIERLPALVLITRNRSNTEILSVINGDCSISELLSSLINAQEMFALQQQIEIKEEGERNMREMIKVEQDEAFQLSLAIDRAKEETKRVQEMEEKAIRSQIESQERQAAAEKEAIRQRIVASLPAEPEPDDQLITKIRFRLPLEKFLERRFMASDSLQVLFDYLYINGFSQEEYKVISSWPRRDLTTLDVTQTMKELNLYPQETLILEER